MSKIIKRTALIAAAITLVPVMAGYRVSLPLENAQGGSLPNGSIIIGQGNGNSSNENNDTDTTGKTCTYIPEGSMVTEFKQAMGALKAGDKGYVYNGNIIGFYSPSNGYSGPPSGVASGSLKESNPEMNNYEICVDENKSYPTVPMPMPEDDNDFPPYVPPEQEDHTGPDWTPECIFNINSDYSAYDKVNRQYVMQSSQFGISIISRTWYHVPADYNPDRAGSYIYLDNSYKTGKFSGPNPDYEYAGICRVRKMEL